MTTPRRLLFAALLLVGFPLAAAAQDVGTVASTSGNAEIGRGGAFAPAETGAGVQLGDELRTGDGKLRIVFQDDSVLNLGENTHLVVDEQVFQPEEGRFSSAFRLLGGKVRAAVAKYYKQPGASYQVETPTAVAGVRGTTFLVSYDDADEVTEVMGIRGKVEVRNLDERIGNAVFVTAHESTTVGSGRAPAQPQVIDPGHFQQRLDDLGFDVLGRQGLGALAAGTSVQSGSSVAPPDRAPLATAKVTSLDNLRDTSDVVGQPLPLIESGRGRLGVPF